MMSPMLPKEFLLDTVAWFFFFRMWKRHIWFEEGSASSYWAIAPLASGPRDTKALIDGISSFLPFCRLSGRPKDSTSPALPSVMGAHMGGNRGEGDFFTVPAFPVVFFSILMAASLHNSFWALFIIAHKNIPSPCLLGAFSIFIMRLFFAIESSLFWTASPQSSLLNC